MHAAIRWFIDHDPGVARPADADPAPLPTRPTWATSWGRPVNQEDLAGTMLTFTTVVIDAFRRSGVEFASSGAEDFLHLWRVIGHFLGVRPGALARRTSPRPSTLQRRIFGRQHAPSAVGVDLDDDAARPRRRPPARAPLAGSARR